MARSVHLRGGDLDDPAVGEAIRAEIVPRLWAQPGALGMLIVVDRPGRAMRSLTFWADEAAVQAVDPEGQRVVTAVQALTAADLRSRDLCRVVLDDVDRATARLREGLDGVVVHVDGLEGGDLSAATARVTDLLTDDPDCLGAVLLAQVDGPTVLCLSLHEAHPDGDTRGAGLFADLAGPGTRAFREGPYEVLVHEQPT